jgi:hypothetical protein
MKWWQRQNFDRMYNASMFDVFVNNKSMGGSRYSEKVPLKE